jgi:sialidase-1
MTDLHLSPLFRSGDDGYHTCRIPALVTTTTGAVLAIAEGRRGGSADDVPIDLLLRRSVDGGCTWSPMQVIVTDGDRTCGNPCPVVDRSSGDIVLPFCKDNQQVFVCRSSDDGLTWSDPADVSSQTRDPSWSYVGSGPGHGIQLHSGRLLIPAWADESPGPVTWRAPGANWGKVQTSYAFYSDDGGHSWQRGQKMDHDATDECEAVEVADRVYMTLRNRRDTHLRGYAWSDNGGQSWSPVAFDEALPEQSCQGSVIRLDASSVLIANAASTMSRAALTVRRSNDGCRSWPHSRVLYPGSAAYCDLTVTTTGEVLCLFEADHYTSLQLARFLPAWLEEQR